MVNSSSQLKQPEKPQRLSKQLLPIQELASAAETLYQNCLRVSEWYAAQLGSLDVIRTILFGSNRTSAQWLQIYQDARDRYDLYNTCQNELREKFQNRINSNLIYVCSQYLGKDQDHDIDAAGGGWLVSLSSNVCLNAYDPARPVETGQIAAYAIGHELGHCLGLPHTSKEYGDATGIEKAIMQRGYPPQAVLVPYEKTKLKSNLFIRKT